MIFAIQVLESTVQKTEKKIIELSNFCLQLNIYTSIHFSLMQEIIIVVFTYWQTYSPFFYMWRANPLTFLWPACFFACTEPSHGTQHPSGQHLVSLYLRLTCAWQWSYTVLGMLVLAIYTLILSLHCPASERRPRCPSAPPFQTLLTAATLFTPLLDTKISDKWFFYLFILFLQEGK